MMYNSDILPEYFMNEIVVFGWPKKESKNGGSSIKKLCGVEILTCRQLIEMKQPWTTTFVTRAMPLKDGEIKASILAEHGFQALVKPRGR